MQAENGRECRVDEWSSSLSLSSKENRQISERHDLVPPVVPGSGDRLGSRNLRPRAEARPTGLAVSKERLGDWDGQGLILHV